jgi:hypothetical protein
MVQRMRWTLQFSIDLILPAALWSWSTQSLAEMSTRNLLVGKERLGGASYNLTAICDCLENVGASTSHKPVSLCGLLQGVLYSALLPVELIVFFIAA